MNKSLTVYLYIGAQGKDQSSILPKVRSRGGWNGGGNGGIDTYDPEHPESGAGGGGSVDVRLIYFDNNLIDDLSSYERSIKSCIMVAGAGGGASSSRVAKDRYQQHYGGHGGELYATNVTNLSIGGTQTSGSFGLGSNGQDFGEQLDEGGFGGSSAGGGSGYRGSIDKNVFSRSVVVETSMAGGSSYISGHPGCMSPSTEEGSHSSTSSHIHFSNISFFNTIMIEGGKLMQSPFGDIISGHSGSGEACITLVSDYFCFTHEPFLIHFSPRYDIFVSFLFDST